VTIALLHLCDSLFPIGGFGYSEGLEAATSAGRVTSAVDLRAWLDTCLDETIGQTDGPAVLQAWRAFHGQDSSALAGLDAELTALRPSSAARRSSRAMGTRLVATWHALYPEHDLAPRLALLGRARTTGMALPVAFGCVCAAAGVEERAAAEAFAYTRLASITSAAMRAMPIGQTDAHAQLAGVLTRVPEVVDRMPRVVQSFTPAMDIASMAQQYLHSRLFRS
jgi:urease accessory protein